MTWLEMMEKTDSPISVLGMIWRYYQHGFALGILAFALVIFGFLMPTIAYPASFLLGAPLITAIFYGLVFIFLGGINQVMAERLWGINSVSTIGTGMRDGFIVFVVFSISYTPMNLAFTSFSIGWSPHPLSPLGSFILLLVSTPIYILLLGFIGEKIAVFIYVDNEPQMPADFRERIRKCPYCGTSYYYSLDRGSKGQIECQNCAKLFSIS